MWTILIVIIVSIIVVLLFVLLSQKNNTAFDHLPDVSVFRDILTDSESNSDYLWVKSLSWSLGRQKNISDLKTYIYDNIILNENDLIFYTNIGPAIGLLSTFIGMILVLINIKADVSSLTSNISILYNLYPVYIGSVLGLLLYIYGNSIKNKFYKTAEQKSEIYLHTFLDIERIILPADPREIADAYAKLLKPISDLILKLDKVNDGFNNFLILQDIYNISQQKNIDHFEKSTKTFIDDYYEKTKIVFQNTGELIESITKANNSLSGTITSIDGYSTNINIYTKNFEKFIGNIKSLDKILADFYKIMPQLNETYKSLSSASNKIDFQIKGINQLQDEINKLALQIIDFNQGISVINTSFSDFIEKIPPKQIVEINNHIEQVSSLIESINSYLIEKVKKPDEIVTYLNDIVDKIIKLNQSLETKSIINFQSDKEKPGDRKIDNVSEAILDVLLNINNTLNKNKRKNINKYISGKIKTIYCRLSGFIRSIFKKISSIFPSNEKKSQ